MFLVVSDFQAQRLMVIKGDSLVLAKTKPAYLCFDKIIPESVIIRSTYEPNQKETVVYKQGNDYIVDFDKGAVCRTENSVIPDYSNHMLYEKKEFDLTDIDNCSNHEYFVWVDYKTQKGFLLSESNNQSMLLKRTKEKLHNGEYFKIIGFGDSIIGGGEASAEHLQFIHRYAGYLSELFPKSSIEVENGSLPGYTTTEGVKSIEEKVLSRQPALVLVAFGMNDSNKICGDGLPLNVFKNNLFNIVTTIKDKTSAEVMLLSAFPPHPDWFFNNQRMHEYAETTARIAQKTYTSYVDVYSIWVKVLKRKNHSSLLGNNINHPNDFGHWLYLQALKRVIF